MNYLRPISHKKGQSSLELLVTLSFGLIILLPIVVLAFIQISTSTSTLAATESQGAATKLADISTVIEYPRIPCKAASSNTGPAECAEYLCRKPDKRSRA